MNIDAYVSVVPPLLAGYLVDKGYLHYVLVVGSILMLGGPGIELLESRSNELAIIMSHSWY